MFGEPAGEPKCVWQWLISNETHWVRTIIAVGSKIKTHWLLSGLVRHSGVATGSQKRSGNISKNRFTPSRSGVRTSHRPPLSHMVFATYWEWRQEPRLWRVYARYAPIGWIPVSVYRQHSQIQRVSPPENPGELFKAPAGAKGRRNARSLIAKKERPHRSK